MSLCSRISEFFGGKPNPVTPAAPAEKPVESFCRSNRYKEWLDALATDMKATGADLIEIKCYEDDNLYRACLGNGFHEDVPGHTRFYNCTTLARMSIADIYRLGVEEGRYESSGPVEIDDREPYQRLSTAIAEKIDPRLHRVIPRFKNDVFYVTRSEIRRQYNPWWHSPKVARKLTPLGKRMGERARLAEPWNKCVRIILKETDTSFLTVEFGMRDLVFQYGKGDKTTLRLLSICKENPVNTGVIEISDWVLRPMLENVKELRLFNTAYLTVVELFDPIRVRLLEPNEEHGMEGYVALNKAKNEDTYTRARYRIEVDSELLYAGTICNMHTLFKQVTQRLKLEDVSDDGKLYVDNFHYMRKNGTEHTGDPAGFSTIGAEPYYRGYERVYRSQLPDDPLKTGIYSYSGPYIITNQIWPEKPIY